MTSHRKTYLEALSDAIKEYDKLLNIYYIAIGALIAVLIAAIIQFSF